PSPRVISLSLFIAGNCRGRSRPASQMRSRLNIRTTTLTIPTTTATTTIRTNEIHKEKKHMLRENLPPLPERMKSLPVSDRGYPVPRSSGDLRWAAGFLEGEGSFSCRSSLQVCATQVQTWPLERLRDLFGGAISTNGRRRPGHSLCSSWYI